MPHEDLWRAAPQGGKSDLHLADRLRGAISVPGDHGLHLYAHPVRQPRPDARPSVLSDLRVVPADRADHHDAAGRRGAATPHDRGAAHCLSLVLLMLVLSGAYAITLGILGRPDWGPIYSGYLGLFLLGAALVAVGLVTSSLVSNQIIAALLSLSIFLLLWIIDYFGWLLPAPFNA